MNRNSKQSQDFQDFYAALLPAKILSYPDPMMTESWYSLVQLIQAFDAGVASAQSERSEATRSDRHPVCATDGCELLIPRHPTKEQAAICWLVDQDWPKDYPWPKEHAAAINAALRSTSTQEGS